MKKILLNVHRPSRLKRKKKKQTLYRDETKIEFGKKRRKEEHVFDLLPQYKNKTRIEKDDDKNKLRLSRVRGCVSFAVSGATPLFSVASRYDFSLLKPPFPSHTQGGSRRRLDDGCSYLPALGENVLKANLSSLTR